MICECSGVDQEGVCGTVCVSSSVLSVHYRTGAVQCGFQKKSPQG